MKTIAKLVEGDLILVGTTDRLELETIKSVKNTNGSISAETVEGTKFSAISNWWREDLINSLGGEHIWFNPAEAAMDMIEYEATCGQDLERSIKEICKLKKIIDTYEMATNNK